MIIVNKKIHVGLQFYTEALKRHDKNIFYLVIKTYKSLNRLSISRYNDL